MKRVPIRFLASALAVSSGCAAFLGHTALAAAAEVRPIHFPVEGPVHYTDTFGAARSGHTHEGQDIMGTKLQHLLATRDGVISTVSITGSGNYFILTDTEGWEYWYLHVNNDSPGTDDGLNPRQWILAPGVAEGTAVKAGQFVGYLGDSGNAEGAGAHLHFEIHRPGGAIINPMASLDAASRGAGLPAPGGSGPSTPAKPPAPPKPVAPPAPPSGSWKLRNGLLGGPADVTFGYGAPTDQALTCDWDGNGADTPGTDRAGSFTMADQNAPGFPAAVVDFGEPADQALCGDWDGDGVDTIGVYRDGGFHLRNTNQPGPDDRSVTLGGPGDVAVVGDWDGDGRDSVGVHRGNVFFLSVGSDGGTTSFAFGEAGAIPVVGDWDGNGRDSVGTFEAGHWSLRNTNDPGPADVTFTFGKASDRPLVGDFNADTVDTVGVFGK